VKAGDKSGNNLSACTSDQFRSGRRGVRWHAHLTGLLVVTIAIIAFAEVARATRFLAVPAGLCLFAAPWVIEGAASPLAQWNSVVVGVLIAGLAVPRGSVRNSYGGSDLFVV
jgi:CBS-domain-containing membrane protein